MELRPGVTFDLDGQHVEYTGMKENPDDSSSPQLVVRLESDKPGEALHRLVTPNDVIERGKNFWTFEELPSAEFARQYHEQVSLLLNAGILKDLGNGQKGIVGIDGVSYPLPDMITVRNEILKKKDIFETKFSQGFNKLLLVPYAMPLRQLYDGYKQEFSKSLGDIDNSTQKVDRTDYVLRTSIPQGLDQVFRGNFALLNGDVDGTLAYYPKEFSENHGGKTKQEILSQKRQDGVLPGWNIVFVEDVDQIPEWSDKPIGGRLPICKDQTIDGALEKLKEPQYQSESGLTPEDALFFALDTLARKKKLADLFVSEEYESFGTMVRLTGVCVTNFRNHPCFTPPEINWTGEARARTVRQLRFDMGVNSRMDEESQENIDRLSGFRTCVRVN